MSLTIKCPECEKSLKVKEEAAGKKVRCPACATAFLAPGKKKSSPPDDDFLADLGQAAKSSRKRPAQDEDFEDELPVTRSRTRPPVKKKSGGRKPKGPNWLLIGGLSAAGLVGLFLLVVVVGQAIKMAASQKANWITFRHPLGFIQGEMPGTPAYNAQQSVNGSQTYTLNRRNCQMSMTAIVLPPGVSSNPTAVDLMFNEIKNKTPQQVPGSRLLSSRRMRAGTTPALEMKIDVKGNVNLMRFYIFPDALVAAEFITRTETAHQADRERFFNSLRGPDGNLIDGPAQPANGIPLTSSSPPTGGMASPPMGGTNSPPVAGSGSPPLSLTETRRALRTRLLRQERSGQPIPEPPATIAKKVSYDSPAGKLAAYLTTIPNDGKKYPAIVWISGGDCNSIGDDFFKNAPANNDQTASAFRKAGIVTMYPSLRGGNENPGFQESFLGEVDDVLAAADFLAKQPGIDPDRIYLGGHSTGGTLVLLTAESTDRFRAIFSFGPVEDIRGYGQEFLPFDSANAAEMLARTPIRWLDTIKNRTFVMEGSQGGNAASLKALTGATQNPQVVFLPVARANHFNILAPVTQLVATKIQQDQGGIVTNISLTEAELNLNYPQ